MAERKLQIRRLPRMARRREEAGQALVELALTMPLLILLLIGAAELARVVYAAIEVSNAARAAAAFAAQNATTATYTASMQTIASADAANLTAVNLAWTPTCQCAMAGMASGITCSAASSTACTTGGGYVVQTLTITTSTSFDPIIHLPGLPSTFTLYGHAVQEVIQ